MTHKLNLWSQVYGALGRSKKTYMERALVMGGEERGEFVPVGTSYLTWQVNVWVPEPSMG